MNDDRTLPLVPRPSGALEKARPGKKPILSGMVADTLTLAKNELSAPAETIFRIGGYEWREPDYRQILIWAKALRQKPEEIIRRLLAGYDGEEPEDGCWVKETKFANNCLKEICWNFEILPLDSFEWIQGLTLEKLNFVNDLDRPVTLDLQLPELTHLNWQNGFLERLNLSGTPKLTHLLCIAGLKVLNLASVPKLIVLDCSFNYRLANLDLASVPMLTELDCSWNELSNLDLSVVPSLTALSCVGNRLAKLDLSHVPKLKDLNCWKNDFETLDLSFVPQLEELNCICPRLKELDISCLRKLKEFYYNGTLSDSPRPSLIQRPDQNF